MEMPIALVYDYLKNLVLTLMKDFEDLKARYEVQHQDKLNEVLRLSVSKDNPFNQNINTMNTQLTEI